MFSKTNNKQRNIFPSMCSNATLYNKTPKLFVYRYVCYCLNFGWFSLFLLPFTLMFINMAFFRFYAVWLDTGWV